MLEKQVNDFIPQTIINTSKIRKGQIIPNYRAFCRILGEPINTNQIEINKQLSQWSQMISFSKIPGSNKFLVEAVHKSLYSLTEETSELDSYVRRENRRSRINTEFQERYHIINTVKIYILLYLLQCPQEETIYSPINIIHEFGEANITASYADIFMSDIFNYGLDSIHLPKISQKILKTKRLVELALTDLYQDKIILMQDILLIDNIPATTEQAISLLGIEKDLLTRYRAINLTMLLQRNEYVEDYYNALYNKVSALGIQTYYRGTKIIFNRKELLYHLNKIVSHANDKLAVSKYNKVLFSTKEDITLFQNRVKCDNDLKLLSKEYESCILFGFMRQKDMLRTLKKKVPISDITLGYLYRNAELLRKYLTLEEDII